MEKVDNKINDITNIPAKDNANDEEKKEEQKLAKSDSKIDPNIVIIPNKVSKIKRTEYKPTGRIGEAQMSRFSRENHNRHRSERLIDRYLVMSEREEAIKNLDKLRMIQKINYKYQKQKLQQLQEDRKKKEEQRRQEMESLREKNKDQNYYQVLYRILKHIQNPSKYSKCLGLLQSLLKDNIDFFCPNTMMNIFDILIKNKPKEDEDKKILQDLYIMF